MFKKGTVLLTGMMAAVICLAGCSGTNSNQTTVATTKTTTAYTGSTASKTTSMLAGAMQPVDMFQGITFQVPVDWTVNPSAMMAKFPDNEKETHNGTVYDYNGKNGQFVVTEMVSKKTDEDRWKYLEERRNNDVTRSQMMVTNVVDGAVAGVPAKIANTSNAAGDLKGAYIIFFIGENAYTMSFVETTDVQSTPADTSQKILATVQPKA